MDKDQQKYYEEQLEMFLSNGWRHFMEDIKRLKEFAQDIRTVENTEFSVGYRKGQLHVLDMIAALPDTIATSYEAAEEMAEAEKQVRGAGYVAENV